jgi:excisionase family DNA binding protein
MVAIKPLLKREEAAEVLCLSIRKLDMLIDAGDIAVVRIGRSVRIRLSAIDSFIDARESRVNRTKKTGGEHA